MVVVPFGYNAFSGWLSLRVPTIVGVVSQLSVAVAVPGLTVAEHEPEAVFVVMFPGQVITGAVVSLTVKVTSLDAPLLLVEPSVASMCTVCGPGPTTVPAAGV